MLGHCLVGLLLFSINLLGTAVWAVNTTVCSSCHNIDGNSTVPAWPNIAGQSERYLLEQLRAFKQGDQGNRPNVVMQGILAPLSDQDLIEFSRYFAAQKPATGSVAHQWLSLGERIYRGGNPKTGVPACGACHDPRGGGNGPAAFPALQGQHPDYIMATLNDFRRGTRKNDPNHIMQDISKRMSDEEIKAVAHYVCGLR
jgi:cytochrome c553